MIINGTFYSEPELRAKFKALEEENAELKKILDLASREVHRPYPDYKYRFEMEAEKLLGDDS